MLHGELSNPHAAFLRAGGSDNNEEGGGIAAISSVATTIGSAVSRRIAGVAAAVSQRLSNPEQAPANGNEDGAASTESGTDGQ